MGLPLLYELGVVVPHKLLKPEVLV